MDNLRRTMSADLKDYSKLYFTILTLEDDNTISIVNYYNYANLEGPPKSGYYSTDGVNWIAYNLSTGNQILNITLNNIGDKVYIKTISSRWKVSSSDTATSRVYFRSTKLCNIYGNILSLVYSDDFVNQTKLGMYSYLYFIFDNLKVVDASNLVMPNNTTNSCYEGMFKNCRTLIKAPELPATLLENKCYYLMFYNCTSLVNAPELPATSLSTDCYYLMFYGCTSLNYIKCLASGFKKYDLDNYAINWVKNVSNTGTFVKSADADNWPRSVSGIPTGWTVIDA